MPSFVSLSQEMHVVACLPSSTSTYHCKIFIQNSSRLFNYRLYLPLYTHLPYLSLSLSIFLALILKSNLSKSKCLPQRILVSLSLSLLFIADKRTALIIGFLIIIMIQCRLSEWRPYSNKPIHFDVRFFVFFVFSWKKEWERKAVSSNKSHLSSWLFNRRRHNEPRWHPSSLSLSHTHT